MKKRSDTTVLAILTILTVLTWVAFDAYRRLIQPVLHDIPPEVLAPLDPSLDTVILDNIEKRRTFTQQEILRYKPEPGVPSAQEAQPEASPPAQTETPGEETGPSALPADEQAQ